MLTDINIYDAAGTIRNIRLLETVRTQDFFGHHRLEESVLVSVVNYMKFRQTYSKKLYLWRLYLFVVYLSHALTIRVRIVVSKMSRI